jgi:GNAT superfamily N-acetyltransferase
VHCNINNKDEISERGKMITVKRCTNENQDFRQLVVLLDADLRATYGEEQAQYAPYNKIDFIETVVVAYEDGKPAGCGCFKEYDPETVEIKRMFVPHEKRGKGISKRVLSGLEKWAAELGYTKSILETGIRQHEAIGLYTGFGYKQIDNYGQYIGKPLSVCMSKGLR